MSSLYQIQLPVFEGPLDLLLRLIEREELDITTIALAQVTDQYLDRLADLERSQAGELADFLVVAAKLVLIKSLALLPSSPSSTKEAKPQKLGAELVHRLQIYKRFKKIAGFLEEREEEGLRSYVRTRPGPRRAPQPDLSDVTPHDLLALAQEALDITSGPAPGEIVSPVPVTVEEQIDHIKRELTQRREIVFRTLFSQGTTRIEIIVTLLALLELLKQDQVRVRQERTFDEIIIEPLTETAPEDAPSTSSTA